MLYSRRKKIEETENKRKAFLFFFLTIICLILIFFSVPIIARFSSFVSEFKKTTEETEVEDTTPPPPPRFDPIPKKTNEEKITIKGSTEPGVSVIISINDKELEVVSNSLGEFNLSFNLKKGENSIYAIAKDTAGNESKPSEKYIVVFDNEPPLIEIIKPTDGSTFFGPKQRQVFIQGKTETGVKLQINSRFVLVEQDGDFSFTTTLSEGENNFVIKAEDEAGNSTEKNLKLVYHP